MAKGQIAKEYAVKKIAEAFGENFVGEFDKKVYINCPENGEMVQIAIAMTCPKKTIGEVNSAPTPSGEYSNTLDFDSPAPTQPSGFTPAEITESETANINKLLASLGL